MGSIPQLTEDQLMVLGEEIAFIIDFTKVGETDPSAAGTTVAYDQTGTDVSASVLAGAASVSGPNVTMKKFTPASAQLYALIQPATIDGNTVFQVVRVKVVDVKQPNFGMI